MKTAQDLMTKNPYYIQSGAELSEVARIFMEKGLHAAPVITPLNEVLGMMTEMSLIRAKLLHHLDSHKHEKVANHAELLAEAVSVDEEAPVTEVIKAIVKSPTSRVLVVGHNGSLKGIISPYDILCFIVGEQKKSTNLRAELEAARQQLSEKEQKLEKLEDLLEVYKDIFLDTPTMMHSVDQNGVIIMANRQFHLNLGYQEGELIGRSMLEIYAKSVHHEALQGLQNIIRDGAHHSTYTTMLKKNGEKLRVDVASRAIYDSTNNFLGSITVSRVVDADLLLRALHGAFNKKKIDEQDLESVFDQLKTSR